MFLSAERISCTIILTTSFIWHKWQRDVIVHLLTKLGKKRTNFIEVILLIDHCCLPIVTLCITIEVLLFRLTNHEGVLVQPIKPSG